MKKIEKILSPSKKYKIEIMKRHDGLFSIEVSRWIEWMTIMHISIEVQLNKVYH